MRLVRFCSAERSGLEITASQRTMSRASDISWKKSKFSRDFQGQIRGKIGRFHAIFAGKKSKFAENRPISRDFNRKKSNFEGFSGANCSKNRLILWEISAGNFTKK